MLYNITRKILIWYAGDVLYRKQEYNETCCCGSDIINERGCSSWDCPSRCMKEYAVSCYVDEKMNHIFSIKGEPK